MSPNMLTINTCKTHGTGYFTAPTPGKNEMRFCVKCIHTGIQKKPRHFFLTEPFRKLVELVAQEG